MTICQIAEQLRLAWTKRGVCVKLANRPTLAASDVALPNPFAPAIVLDLEAQDRLQALSRAHSTPQALAFVAA